MRPAIFLCLTVAAESLNSLSASGSQGFSRLGKNLTPSRLPSLENPAEGTANQHRGVHGGQRPASRPRSQHGLPSCANAPTDRGVLLRVHQSFRTPDPKLFPSKSMHASDAAGLTTAQLTIINWRILTPPSVASIAPLNKLSTITSNPGLFGVKHINDGRFRVGTAQNARLIPLVLMTW